MTQFAVKLEQVTDTAEDFFRQMLDVVKEPTRLCHPETKQVGIDLLPHWVMERINEIRQRDPQLAREIRAIASNEDSILLKEINKILSMSSTNTRVQKQLSAAFCVNSAD